jgi:hypothetical protein
MVAGAGEQPELCSYRDHSISGPWPGTGKIDGIIGGGEKGARHADI